MRAEAGGFCGSPPAPGGAGWAGEGAGGGCGGKIGVAASQALKLVDTNHTHTLIIYPILNYLI